VYLFRTNLEFFRVIQSHFRIKKRTTFLPSEHTEENLFNALTQGNISRILLPDFLEAMYYLTNYHRKHFGDTLRIVQSIRHPFSFGISVVSYYEIDPKFLGCLGTWLKWFDMRVWNNIVKYFPAIMNI
jgi:hypothetical protein